MERKWDYFMTLTFRFSVDEIEAARIFEQRYIQRLQQRSQGRVLHFGVAARNHPLARVHIHALICFFRPLPVSAAVEAWREGNAQVRTYNPLRRAAEYIAKHVAHENREVMIRQY